MIPEPRDLEGFGESDHILRPPDSGLDVDAYAADDQGTRTVP